MAQIKKAELRPAFVYLNKQRGKKFTEIAALFGVHRTTVSDAIRRFDETSSNKNRPGSGRKRTATGEIKRQEVAEAITQNPSTKVNSTRKLARRFRISNASVHRILTRDLGLFPYKMHRRQLLDPIHIQKRLTMCRAMSQRLVSCFYCSLTGNFSDLRMKVIA
jgi:transposase